MQLNCPGYSTRRTEKGTETHLTYTLDVITSAIQPTMFKQLAHRKALLKLIRDAALHGVKYVPYRLEHNLIIAASE